MHIPKKFDVNTHGSLVRFLIKFVKEFNDLVKTVSALTETVKEQAVEPETVEVIDKDTGNPDEEKESEEKHEEN